MLFNIGDLVTRKSYNNDTVFEITDIKNKTVILKGINIRLIADADISDLSKCDDCLENITSDDRTISEEISKSLSLDRDNYFYLPGRVLHIDADKNYLDRCMKFYNDMNVVSYGFVCKESDIHLNINNNLNDINPDVLVITGHDAFNDNSNNYEDISNYKNSANFIKAIKAARKYEKDHSKLIIIAGACQSNYEELIKAGSNFASSPKRINIHALDPAIIASSVCLSKRGEDIDLIKILEQTKYGKDGIGGIITEGVMYVGFPR